MRKKLAPLVAPPPTAQVPAHRPRGGGPRVPRLPPSWSWYPTDQHSYKQKHVLVILFYHRFLDNSSCVPFYTVTASWLKDANVRKL